MAQANVAPDAAIPSDGYRAEFPIPHDRETGRAWVGRWIVAGLIVAASLAGPYMFVAYWGSELSNETVGEFLGWFGLLAGGVALARFLPSRLMLLNQEWSAYVSQNVPAGTMVSYGPGVHVTYPWEARNKKGNWSLKLITRDFTLPIPTDTSQVTMAGKYGYTIDLARIQNAIGMKDDASIDDRLTSLIESFLTGESAGKEAGAVVRDSTPVINAGLKKSFHRAKIDNPNTRIDERTIETISERYGIKLVFVTVNRVSFPPAVQKARDAKEEAAQMFEIVAQLYGYDTEEKKKELRQKITSGSIPKGDYDKMLNRAMAASENATMNIQVIEGGAQGVVIPGINQNQGGGS